MKVLIKLQKHQTGWSCYIMHRGTRNAKGLYYTNKKTFQRLDDPINDWVHKRSLLYSLAKIAKVYKCKQVGIHEDFLYKGTLNKEVLLCKYKPVLKGTYEGRLKDFYNVN